MALFIAPESQSIATTLEGRVYNHCSHVILPGFPLKHEFLAQWGMEAQALLDQTELCIAKMAISVISVMRLTFLLNEM